MRLPNIAPSAASLGKDCADYCDVARRRYELFEAAEQANAATLGDAKVAAMHAQLSRLGRQLGTLLGRICRTPVQDQESVIALSEVLRFRLAQCPPEDSADAVLLLRLLAGIHYLFPTPDGPGAKPTLQVVGKTRAKRSTRYARCEDRPSVDRIDTSGALSGQAA